MNKRTEDFIKYLDNLRDADMDSVETHNNPKHYKPRLATEIDDYAKELLGDKIIRQSAIKAEHCSKIKTLEDIVNYVAEWNFYSVKNCKRLATDVVVSVRDDSNNLKEQLAVIEEAICIQVPPSAKWINNQSWRDVFGRFRLAIKIVDIEKSIIPYFRKGISGKDITYNIELQVFEPRWSYNVGKLSMAEWYYFDSVLAYWIALDDRGASRLIDYIKEFAYKGKFNWKAIDYLAQRTIPKGQYYKYFLKHRRKTGIQVAPFPVSLFDKCDHWELPENIIHYKERNTHNIVKLADGKYKQKKNVK